MIAGKRALVFGGAGFIGRHLVASLLARGYEEVTSADIRAPGSPATGVRYLTCDVRNTIPTDLVATAPDEVYNLAAVHRVPGHPDHEYFDTNRPGASNVCAYCREVGVSRLVFTSSISVYGPAEKAKDEDAPPAPVTAYGKSKLEAEAIHRAWAKEDAARRLVVVRPAVVFGPGEGANFSRLATALRRRAFIYPGCRDTVKGCGSIDDLIGSMAFALGRDRNFFQYNYCYPKPYTIEDICEAFHRVAGLPRPMFTIPTKPMLAGARLFELLATVGIDTGINRARIMKLVQSTHIVPKALVAEGYQFQTDLEEGLRRWRMVRPEGKFV